MSNTEFNNFMEDYIAYENAGMEEDYLELI